MDIWCLSRGLDALKTWVSAHGAECTIAFIPNAGDTYQDPYFVKESKERLELLGINVLTVDLRQVDSAADFRRKVERTDGVFVAGGNSYNLLYELKRSHAFDELRKMILKGFSYFGESAGAVILYRTIEPVAMIDDPGDVPQLTSTDSLGVVNFITLPHVNREKYASTFDAFRQAQSGKHRIVEIRDDQAIRTRDGVEVDIVESGIGELG